MRGLSPLAFLLGVACASVQPTRPAPASANLAITRVALVDVERGTVIPEQTVVITGDRIREVGPSANVRIPAGTRVVDAAGRYLIPGLIDTHTHLSWDLDHLTAPDSAARSLLLQVANGVTTIREASTRGQERTQLSVRAAQERNGVPLPRIYVSGRVDGRNVARHAAGTPRDLTRRLIELGVDGIKIRDGLTIADVRGVVQEAHLAGRPVFGHVEAYPLEAVRAGIDGVMHVDGLLLLPPGGHPEPAPADATDWEASRIHQMVGWLYGDRAATDTLLRAMLTRDTWLEPTLVIQEWIANPDLYRDHRSGRYRVGAYARAREGFPTPVGTTRDRLQASVAQMKDLVRRFHHMGGRIIAGTDDVPLPGFAVHEEMRLLVEAGLSPHAALQAATSNAASALGWEDRIGAIRPGQLADLVLLDADPLADIANTTKIRSVVLNGRYLDRSALDAILADVERVVAAPEK